MNLYLQAMAEAMNGAPTYAWMIHRDNLADREVSVWGPRNAPEELVERLRAREGKTWTFSLYDDDGIRYFTGRLATLADSPEDDETGPSGALMAPLSDYGEAFGCVRIGWAGHPEWEIG